jgi:hypothetical protein
MLIQYEHKIDEATYSPVLHLKIKMQPFTTKDLDEGYDLILAVEFIEEMKKIAKHMNEEVDMAMWKTGAR